MYEINIHFSDFAVEEQTKISNRKSDSTVSQLEKVSFGFCLSISVFRSFNETMTDRPTDSQTDRPTDSRTRPLIEMRGRI